MVNIIELTQQRVMKPEIIHPYVIDTGDGITLVDCGDPELAGTITDELTLRGLDWHKIKNIVITHHDLDHMGGLSQFLDILPDVTVMATVEQADYICGKARWLRLQDEDRKYLSTPPEKRIPSGRVRADQYRYFLPGRVDKIIRNGDILPECGNPVVISTPWHMPGHISLYLAEEKTLITGDAFQTFDGVLGLNRAVDLAPDETAPGLMKIMDLDVETVCGYHGGRLELKAGAFKEEVQRLLKELD